MMHYFIRIPLVLVVDSVSETFPVEQLKELVMIFLILVRLILEYGITEGDGSFKKAAIEFLSRHETVVKDYDGVMVTSGSQQIMDFLSKCLCNEGDLVVCEIQAF